MTRLVVLKNFNIFNLTPSLLLSSMKKADMIIS